jgi:hypothetical protein
VDEGHTAETQPREPAPAARVGTGQEATTAPRRQPWSGVLDRPGVLALQRSAGNATVARLVAARTPTATAPPVATAAPSITAFGWKDAKLGTTVDSGTAEQLATYLASLTPAARDAALAELQGARRHYRGQLTGTDRPTAIAISERVQRADVSLHASYSDTAVAQGAGGADAPAGGWARGKRPPGLTAGTHTPTAAERDELRDAMAPARRRSASGQLADFHSAAPAGTSDAYEQRIYKHLHETIDRLLIDLVDNKRSADHRDSSKLNPWARYEELAAIAKEETDKVFGRYVTGPTFRHTNGRHLGNLRDRFEEEVASQAALGRGGRRQQAEQLIEYFLQSERAIQKINAEHDAVPERTTLSPGETRSEADILAGAVKTIAAAREQQLLDIDRGWEGTAGGGIVSLQRWKASDDHGQRAHFWDSFQTMIHEYLHTLTHPAYSAYANTMPGGDKSLQYNTLIEGMTSAMTEIVWVNVAPRVRDKTFAERVETPALYIDPDESAAACPVVPARYPSYHQAMELITIVGPRNVFAAYLLGEVDMIRAAAAPKKP